MTLIDADSIAGYLCELAGERGLAGADLPPWRVSHARHLQNRLFEELMHHLRFYGQRKDCLEEPLEAALAELEKLLENQAFLC